MSDMVRERVRPLADLLMQRLLGVAFAMLLLGELITLGVALCLFGLVPYLLWQESPWLAGVAATLLMLGLAWAFWRLRSARTVDEMRITTR